MPILETLPDDGLLPGETVDPATGEITSSLSTVQQSLMLPVKNKLIALTDRDSVIDAYDYLKELSDAIDIAKLTLRQSIARMTEGDAKTRRVRHSDGRNAVVEMPSDSWDNKKLKSLWDSTAEPMRSEFLKIDKVAVKMIEFKKATNASGSEEFNAFRDALNLCNVKATGTPTVKIEQAKSANGKVAAKNVVDAESVKAVVDGPATNELATTATAMTFDDI